MKLATIVCLLMAAITLSACKSGLSIPFFGGAGTTENASPPPSQGALMSFETLRTMSFLFAMPGLLMVIAGAIFFPPILRVGCTLLALGVVIALVPWLVATITLPIQIALWCLLAAGVTVLAYWVLNRIGLLHRIKTVKAKLAETNGNHIQEVKQAGALAALQRLANPAVDKAFRKGTMTVDTLIQEIKTP
jgi:hypothetical protein